MITLKPSVLQAYLLLSFYAFKKEMFFLRVGQHVFVEKMLLL